MQKLKNSFLSFVFDIIGTLLYPPAASSSLLRFTPPLSCLNGWSVQLRVSCCCMVRMIMSRGEIPSSMIFTPVLFVLVSALTMQH